MNITKFNQYNNIINKVECLDLFKLTTKEFIEFYVNLFECDYLFFSNTLKKYDGSYEIINADTYYDNTNFILECKKNYNNFTDPIFNYAQSYDYPFSIEKMLNEYHEKIVFHDFINFYYSFNFHHGISYHFKSQTNSGTYISFGYNKRRSLKDIQNYLFMVLTFAPHINDYLYKEYLTNKRNTIILLTKRELQIFELFKRGDKLSDISKILYISVRTVRFHLNNIVCKLDAKNKYHALYIALKLNLI